MWAARPRSFTSLCSPIASAGCGKATTFQHGPTGPRSLAHEVCRPTHTHFTPCGHRISPGMVRGGGTTARGSGLRAPRDQQQSVKPISLCGGWGDLVWRMTPPRDDAAPHIPYHPFLTTEPSAGSRCRPPDRIEGKCIRKATVKPLVWGAGAGRMSATCGPTAG